MIENCEFIANELKCAMSLLKGFDFDNFINLSQDRLLVFKWEREREGEG